MGVNIETWRARIGCFSCCGKLKGPKMAAITVSMSPVSERAFVALVVILALLILGGIEQNPGPGPDSTRQNSTRQQRITKQVSMDTKLRPDRGLKYFFMVNYFTLFSLYGSLLGQVIRKFLSISLYLRRLPR